MLVGGWLVGVGGWLMLGGWLVLVIGLEGVGRWLVLVWVGFGGEYFPVDFFDVEVTHTRANFLAASCPQIFFEI